MADTAGFDKLARALRELHRVLMERARKDYERERLTSVTPGELLKLLTTDEAFAWLRELSELMADIDIVREAESHVLEASSSAIRPAAEHLLSAPGASTPFAQRYWTYVHDDPHVAMAHAGVKQALNLWPPSDPGAQSGADHRRDLRRSALSLGRGRQA
jgi:hypothetical protein